MKKFTLLLLATLLTCSTLSAAEATWPWKRNKERKSKRARTEQVTADTTTRTTTQKTERPAAVEAPEPVINDITLHLSAEQADSLVAVWREQLYGGETIDKYREEFVTLDSTAVVPALPDSVYARRLRDLVSPIPLPYNEVVGKHIARYLNVSWGTINRIIGRSRYYFPMIEDELLRADLPVELRAMAVIESALNATAVSRAGAAGLWQFMPSTGKVYGLEVNSLVDERYDPVLATKAACRYMKDLYNIYNDWSLAIAAYNCGPGNVNKAMARSGGKNFWEIYDFLPRETRGYVPAFIGATYAYAYYKEHDITPAATPIPLAVDTVHVTRLLHLGQVADATGIPIETLRQLNPQYKRDVIPATQKRYTLTLPQRNVAKYIAEEQRMHEQDSVYLKDYLNPANLTKAIRESGVTYHTVKSGETLGSIARRYHVTVKQLMDWNGIKNANKLRLGQRLRVARR